VEGDDIDEDVQYAAKRPRVVLRLAVCEEGIKCVGDRLAQEEKVVAARQERVRSRELKTRAREQKAARRQAKEAELRRKRLAANPGTSFKDDGGQGAGRPATIKSAWQIFLDEQLPKERALRPDDDERTSMRNMSRLWGLMSPHERAVYEEKAKAARLGLSPFGGAPADKAQQAAIAAAVAAADAAAEATRKVRVLPHAHVAGRTLAPRGTRSAGRTSAGAAGASATERGAPAPATPRVSRKSARQAAVSSEGEDGEEDDDDGLDRAFDAGLFCMPPPQLPAASSPASGEASKAAASVATATGRSRRLASVGLPTRRSLGAHRAGRDVTMAGWEDSDLDALFPTALDEERTRVRPPPASRRNR
jgi:hypothetical protein